MKMLWGRGRARAYSVTVSSHLAVQENLLTEIVSYSLFETTKYYRAVSVGVNSIVPLVDLKTPSYSSNNPLL